MKAKFILFMYKRGLICHDLFTSWNNPENKERKVEGVVDEVKLSSLIGAGLIFFIGLTLLLLASAIFFHPYKDVGSGPAYFFGIVGLIAILAAIIMWWDRQTLINDFVDLDSLLATQQGHYVLNLDYTTIRKLAQDCLRYLGSQLRAAESHSGVDSRPARKARRKFKNAHRVFYAFGLVEKSQGSYTN
jgi:hypothetical protein